MRRIVSLFAAAVAVVAALSASQAEASTVHVVLGAVSAQSANSNPMPVIGSVPIATETLVSSASSQQGVTIATSKSVQIWEITASGGKVWVAFGTNPTAASGSGFLILDGQTRDFAVTMAGEKIAIKDAP